MSDEDATGAADGNAKNEDGKKRPDGFIAIPLRGPGVAARAKLAMFDLTIVAFLCTPQQQNKLVLDENDKNKSDRVCCITVMTKRGHNHFAH